MIRHEVQLPIAYTCLLHAGNLETDLYNVMTLPKSVYHILAHIHDEQLLLCGRSVQDWAYQLGLSVNTMIDTTATTRPSTTIDAYIASQVVDISVWIFHENLTPNSITHPTPPQLSILHTPNHFQVIATPPTASEAATMHCETSTHNITTSANQSTPAPLMAPRLDHMVRMLKQQVHFTQQLNTPHSRHIHSARHHAHMRIITASLQYLHFQAINATASNSIPV
eukprot:1747875-Amphidinium_carterae.1